MNARQPSPGCKQCSSGVHCGRIKRGNVGLGMLGPARVGIDYHYVAVC